MMNFTLEKPADLLGNKYKFEINIRNMYLRIENSESGLGADTLGIILGGRVVESQYHVVRICQHK